MSLRRSVAWSFTGNGAMFVSSLATSMIVARLLTPVEMGTFAISVATVSVVQAMLQMGLASFLVTEKELEPAAVGSALTVAGLQGLTISACVLALAPIIGSVQRSSEVTHLIILISLVPLISSLESVAIALWSRGMNFRTIALVGTLKAVAQGSLSIVLALAGFGAISLGAGYLFAALVGLGASLPCLLKYRPSLSHWRRLAKFGGTWMVLGGIRALNARIPEFLLGRLVGLAATGYYNRASASIDMVSRAAIDPVARVFLPALSKQNQQNGSLADGVLKFSTLLTATFWPMLGLLALLAHPVVRVLYGSQWEVAAPALSALCLWMAFSLLGSGAGEVLLIRGRLNLAAQIEIGRAVLALSLIALAAPFGITAVAGARVVETMIGTIPYLIMLRRLAGVSVRRWLLGHGVSAVLAGFAVLPVWTFRSLVDPPRSPLLELIVAGAIFVPAFLLGILVLKHPLAADLKRLLTHLRSRAPRLSR